jgi:hypothetical protein
VQSSSIVDVVGKGVGAGVGVIVGSGIGVGVIVGSGIGVGVIVGSGIGVGVIVGSGIGVGVCAEARGGIARPQHKIKPISPNKTRAIKEYLYLIIDTPQFSDQWF